MKTTNKIKVCLALLVLLTFTLVVLVFVSIYDSKDDDQNIIEVNPAENVETSLEVINQTTNQALVPMGHQGESQQIYNFKLIWNGFGASGAVGRLEVESNIYDLNGGLNSEQLNYMFKIKHLKEDVIIAGTDYEFQIEVVFKNEPRDKEEYSKITKGKIVINLIFKVITENGEQI